MSRGPGRIQRAVLDAIATPAASASFDCETPYGSGGPGPVGVPLDAIFGTVYGTYRPTRAQRVAVHRAVRVLVADGAIDTYSRRSCPSRHEVADYVAWPEVCPDCRWVHIPTAVVGRPRTDAEEQARQKEFAVAMAMAKAALG